MYNYCSTLWLRDAVAEWESKDVAELAYLFEKEELKKNQKFDYSAISALSYVAAEQAVTK